MITHQRKSAERGIWLPPIIALIAMLALGYTLTPAYGQDDFNPPLLGTDDTVGVNIDLSIFENGGQGQIYYDLKGGIIGNEDGITVNQRFAETVARVEAAGASEVFVSNQPDVKTVWRGYTVVPYALPYRKNPTALDVTTLADDIAFEVTHRSVIPTRRKISRVSVNTDTGRRILMRIIRPDGTPVPTGTSVYDAATTGHAFLVGGDGLVYLTGMKDSGTLIVKWGDGSGNACRLSYALPAEKENARIEIFDARCQ